MCKYLKSTYTYIGKIFNWFYFLYFLFFFFFAIVGKKVSIYRIGSFLSVNFKMREKKKKKRKFGTSKLFIFLFTLYHLISFEGMTRYD